MSRGNPQSFNRYSYVENEPTNFVDPSGLNAAFIVCYDLTTYYSNPNGPNTRTETTTICHVFGGSGGGIPTTGGEDFPGGAVGTVGDCPFGPTVCAAEAARSQAREAARIAANRDRKQRAEEQVKKSAFQKCLSAAMFSAKLAVGALLGAATNDIRKSPEPYERAITLGITLIALKAAEESFETARETAIGKCRSDTGYAGPLAGDNRPWFLRPASEVLFGQ